MESITGSVEEVIFYNDDNGYCVCDINCSEKLITAVGILPCISPGETVTLTGEYGNHPVYGEQFCVSSFVKAAPNSVESIFKYLASGFIKGVGAVTAKKIVDKFGSESLEIIENHPEKLAEIKGITPKKSYEINDSYIMQFGMRNLVMFLQENNISSAFAAKIHKKYGNNAIEKIKKNPYILAKDIHGIGFSTADKIALKLGIDENDPERVQSAVQFVLYEYAMSGGNTYCPSATLIAKTCRLIDCHPDTVSSAITSLALEKSVVIERKNDYDAVYLTLFHIAEENCAYMLKQLNAEFPDKETDELNLLIERVEKHTGIVLAEMQRTAVMQAITTPVTVITGGPGTGKTTIINTIIKVMELMAKSVVLAAPTGRAAKRMSEVTGYEAKTLHRLLESGYSTGDDRMQFIRNESNPIEAQVIIIDEMSMVDILLFNSLLKAIPKGTKLILVGDADQLPSVGPGNVLRDIINSGGIVTAKLTEIFRQEHQSMIVINAHRINKGEMPNLNIKGKDFFFLPRSNAEDIVNTIVNLCTVRLPKAYGYNPFCDIQVLTPMRKNAVGVNVLNKALQQAMNPPSSNKPEKKLGDITYRIQDKIMQIRNNYDIEWNINNIKGTGLFNGDIGIIKDIDDDAETLKIVFDDEKNVEYDFTSFNELEMAYATTVHKSQGSEFPVVILPIFTSPNTMMNRNLLYTAITRAKKLVILVGMQNILEQIVSNNSETKRFSGLKERLEYK